MTRLFSGTAFDRPPRCDRCSQLEEECQCPPLEQQAERVPPEKQTARIMVEKRKKGKWVTVVRGLAAADLPGLLTQLKSVCGAGGTVKDEVVEVQGKHQDRVAGYLRGAGYGVKG